MWDKKKNYPKATVRRSSCTLSAAVQKCSTCIYLTSISFCLLNSCSYLEKETVFLGISNPPGDMCQDKSQAVSDPDVRPATSLPVTQGSEQREAERSKLCCTQHLSSQCSAQTQRGPRDQCGMSPAQNLLRQLGWYFFKSHH